MMMEMKMVMLPDPSPSLSFPVLLQHTESGIGDDTDDRDE